MASGIELARLSARGAGADPFNVHCICKALLPPRPHRTPAPLRLHAALALRRRAAWGPHAALLRAPMPTP